MALFVAGRLSAADPLVPQPQPASRTNASSAAIIPPPNALRSFQVKPGFRLELVASEPLVINPIAMAFDEDGRLFVIEKWDEAGGNDGTHGRVRLLEDTDGDGVFNASTVYAKDLTSPSALICYGGGVFVACGDGIIYLKDSKGDGVADARREVFKGFGEATNGANGKMIITGMAWGLDNKIHVSTASRGGDVISSSSPRQSLILSEGDFNFDPRTFALEAESGSAPSGIAFDNRGRKFVASNRHHIQMVMYESRYATRNPSYKMPGVLLNIAAGEGSAHLTDVWSIAIYRGNVFPPEYLGNAFVADGTASLVHRDKLRPNDVGMIAERAADEAGTEFLVCRDRSFQPMQLANAPDGTLYVAGLIRETAKADANLNGVQGRGRIFRVLPLNFKQPKLPQMSKASAGQLVVLLWHLNGWHRDTAARLLYERQDKAAFVPLVQLLYDVNSPPLARVHALHALEGMNMLAPAHLVRALNDPDDRVREHAVLLSEKFITKDGILPDILFSQISRLAGDPSPRVRYQLAFSLGQLDNVDRVQRLADIVRSDVFSRWMQSAVLSSLNQGASEMFGLLASDANLHDGNAGGEFLRQLLLIIGAKNETEEVPGTVNALNAISDPQLAFDLVQTLDNGLQSANSSLEAADRRGVLKPLYSRAMRLALDESVAEPLRVQALRLTAATKFADPQWSMVLAQEWPYLEAKYRGEAVVALLSRPDPTGALLWGLERGTIPISDLSATQIRFLLVHPDQNLRQRAVNLFGNGAGIRGEEAVNRFLPALQMSGTTDRGHNLYLGRCATCHRLGDEGNPSGVDLDGAAKRGGEKLLVKILDPNREASPDPSGVLLQTNDGQTLTGFITGQTAKSVTLCQANGVEKVVGRENIQSLGSLGISAMPEGLETGLNQQDMSDLLAYLTSSTR